jgi:predicted O-methyltransferase YrrM
MEDQMLRQLIMKAPMLQVIDLVRERDYLDIAELKRGLAFESSDVIFID